MTHKLITFNDGREPIVISNEVKLAGDLVFSTSIDYNMQVVPEGLEKAYNDVEHYFKVIAQGFSQIDFNGLESEFGVVDVDMLARNETAKLCYSGPNASRDSECFIWKKGFETNQQLNTKKFSEKDIRKALRQGEANEYSVSHTLSDDEFIQSLSKPYQIFDVEVEVETELQAYYRNGVGGKKLKILKKL